MTSPLEQRLAAALAAWVRALTRLLPRALPLLAVLVALLLGVQPVLAAELRVSEVSLQPCPTGDGADQPQGRGLGGAQCYALRGVVDNSSRRTVVDTDVYARILDASGEPVLPNRTRVGSIGDVPPGRSDFALRLAVPAGTPGPIGFSHVKARGFSAPVRSRAGEDDELLPLEQALEPAPPQAAE
ncbi:MAG: hypothetical protein QM522_04870 [Chitinophagaceae bacterium]|nr:hypothetical protein [Chitinophagaceae bacterium]